MNPIAGLAWLALTVTACGLAAEAGAQAIHKCRDGHGVVRYQDAPCPATQRTEWVREADAAPPPAVPALQARTAAPPPIAARSARATASRRPRTAGGVRGTVISQHRDAAACERAKKAREQAYARLGLRRDFATSRRMDDRVYAACR